MSTWRFKITGRSDFWTESTGQDASETILGGKPHEEVFNPEAYHAFQKVMKSSYFIRQILTLHSSRIRPEI
ncbi:MAG: hypothetical protein R2850_04110 [Bacteroidia bacterium]